MGGVLAAAVVVTVSVSVTGEALVTLTDGEVSLQVAPVGQPLATLRLTVPVNPLAGVTLIAVVPVWPAAGMLRGEGVAERLKSETATGAALEVEVA
jgi:hypothetical protein